MAEFSFLGEQYL